MRTETVKIKSDNQWGFIIINKSDYDRSIHTLYDAETESTNVGVTSNHRLTRKKRNLKNA